MSGTSQSIRERLSIVTTTHLLPSAPSVAVLRSTVKRLRRYMDVAGCRHLVYYDQPGDGAARAAKYQANLKRLGQQIGLEVYVRPQSGLKKNLLEALQTITTPYLLFLEHDWAFRRPVPIGQLLDVFDKYKFVNHVRFNMRYNDSHYMGDHLTEPEDRITELKLTRTSAWSNNPHVARVSKWQRDWLAIIGPEPSTGPYGVEDKLYWLYNRDIFTKGFREAHAEWGQYLYGGANARPYVYHANGAFYMAHGLEYPMKVKRLAKRLIRRYFSD